MIILYEVNKLKQITNLNSQSTQCWRMKFKKNNKKTKKKTWVNLLNQWPGSWDLDNLIESKQTKWPESTRINLSNMRPRSWNYDNPIKMNQNKLWSLILNKLNVE